MEFLIININFSKFWPCAFPHLGLQGLSLLFILKRGAHLHNARLLDEVREIEGRLLYATFTL